MSHSPLSPRLCLLLLALALPSVPGCSGGSGREGMGTVSGTVLYRGEPLRGGTIHFILGKKEKTSLWIRGDGTYSGEVLVGSARVAVETESVKYTDRKTMLKKWQQRNPELAGKKQAALDLPVSLPTLVYTPIPERYSDPDKSGLTCEVTRGAQRHDFELEGPGGTASR
jgi:hypothetical protein